MGKLLYMKEGKAASLINRSQFVRTLTVPLVNPDPETITIVTINYLEVGHSLTLLQIHTHLTGRFYFPKTIIVHVK